MTMRFISISAAWMRFASEMRSRRGGVIKLKHSVSCSEALNKIIADNINKELVVTLQQQELLKAKIGSQMKTENGFSQATADKTVARNIYDFYQ
ncbi:hypothetical protein [Raoultella terrigena]|uniref:hypothetical protein n=1 Tax=Raoultella terrigena TaxID=577 RepID=UPI001269BECD|nr:hypothetical protein [Raoultella terrigena]